MMMNKYHRQLKLLVHAGDIHCALVRGAAVYRYSTQAQSDCESLDYCNTATEQQMPGCAEAEGRQCNDVNSMTHVDNTAEAPDMA